MLRTISLLGVTLTALALAVVAGCQQANDREPQTVKDKSGTNTPVGIRDGEHGHKPGSHGGNIVEIGRDNHHAEVVFAKDGVVRLYLLGKDETRVQEVETQTLTAYARPEGGTESVAFKLEPAPTKEDAAGKTSQFAGTLPPALRGKQVEVTVPGIRIAGERFRFSFKSAPVENHARRPASASTEKAKKLYLTAGGKYTAADIQANGGLTATQKYGDKTSSHDSNPSPGDRICPITDTRANPEFTWVVGGKAYQFCCPPCIDEFLETAKTKPKEIKEPTDYVKR